MMELKEIKVTVNNRGRYKDMESLLSDKVFINTNEGFVFLCQDANEESLKFDRNRETFVSRKYIAVMSVGDALKIMKSIEKLECHFEFLHPSPCWEYSQFAIVEIR